MQLEKHINNLEKIFRREQKSMTRDRARSMAKSIKTLKMAWNNLYADTQERQLIKLKDILLEKKELNPRFIKDIAKMTDRNNHILARFTIAKYLGNDRLSIFYQAATILNDVFGHTPPELSKLQQKMEKELYRQLVRTYKNYDAIYDAL